MQWFSYKSNQQNYLNHLTINLPTETMYITIATFHYHHVTLVSWNISSFCLSFPVAMCLVIDNASKVVQVMFITFDMHLHILINRGLPV